ncbi:MAG TPA: hypothetical protein VIC51_11085 [Psychromonas sp.]
MSKATNEMIGSAEKLNINNGEFLIVKIDLKKFGQLSWAKIDNLRRAFGETKVLIADSSFEFEKASIDDLENMLKQLKGEDNE